MNHLKNPSNLFFEACPREVTLSLSAKRKPGTTEHYESTTLPIEEVVNMLSDHRVGSKNEWGWCPFDFQDDIRSRANAIGADFAVLDIDDGTPLGDIEGALEDAGIAALVTSTYSHLSKETDFRVSEYDAWRKRRPDAADEDFMRHHRKGFVEAVWRGSTIVRGRDKQLVTKVVRERGERVEKFTVRHAACEKYRVVVPLARAFLSKDHGDADAAWKTIVLALADDSGLKTDKNTLDRARVFFGPRHPAGIRPARRFVPGEPFDWRMALALVRTARGRGREGREAHQGASLARQPTSAVKIYNGDIALLREAVMSVRNDERFDDRSEWLKFLAAIHRETDGSDDGLELALDWSATWDTGSDNPAETERVWNSFRDDREGGATGATIRAYAARDGFRGPEGFVYGDGRAEPSFDFRDERDEARPESRQQGLRFHYAGDLHRLPEATYLVKGLLFESQLSCIFGQPGASKTFFALDVALHIALGRQWFGCDVKRGVVVYVALEGISGIRKRAEAACKHHGVKLTSVPIVFADGMMDLANDKGSPTQIADEAKRASDHFGFPIRTIIIDTLARAMSGGDENSSRDMGALIAGADKLRMATGAHVCLVHHEGKDRDKGMRGSSALFGAVDTAIAIGRDKNNPHAFEVRMTKQKEDEIGSDVPLKNPPSID